MSDDTEPQTHTFEEVWHQVAGHKGHGSAPGFLMSKNGTLYKNISHDKRGEREEQFYKTVFSEENFKAFREFIPTYYTTIEYLSCKYIALADACHGFKVPCGSDIKVGTVDYCSLDSPSKQQNHQTKDLGIAPVLGFRFAGANVYNAKSKQVAKLDKNWGLSFTVENSALKTQQYFNNGVEVRSDVLPIILSQISALKDYYSSQDLFWLCRCSLLIVYDGLTRGKAVVKLIDFAHNVSQEIASDNTHVEVGLHNLQHILQHILEGRADQWTYTAHS